MNGEPAENILLEDEVIGNIRLCDDDLWYVTLNEDYELLRLWDYPQGCGVTKEFAVEDAINSAIKEAKKYITSMELLRLTLYGIRKSDMTL